MRLCTTSLAPHLPPLHHALLLRGASAARVNMAVSNHTRHHTTPAAPGTYHARVQAAPQQPTQSMKWHESTLAHSTCVRVHVQGLPTQKMQPSTLPILGAHLPRVAAQPTGPHSQHRRRQAPAVSRACAHTMPQPRSPRWQAARPPASRPLRCAPAQLTVRPYAMPAMYRFLLHFSLT